MKSSLYQDTFKAPSYDRRNDVQGGDYHGIGQPGKMGKLRSGFASPVSTKQSDKFREKLEKKPITVA